MDQLWERYTEAPHTCHGHRVPNKDGYSRDNVLVGEDGYVRVFDRSRTVPGLSGVEISYASFRNKSSPISSDGRTTCSSKLSIPALRSAASSARTSRDHRYYSVGSLERLPLTETFLARRPAVMLDRDGVLNRRPPRAEYVSNRSEFEWLPGRSRRCGSCRRAGLPGDRRLEPGRRRARRDDGGRPVQLHDWMKAEDAEAGGRIDAIYYCPHGWDEGCECRKPRPGMLFQAQRDFTWT